jgi:GTP cyclohydrolase IA
MTLTTTSFTNTIRDLLELIGDDPNRDGLRGTPVRVMQSFNELFSGYGFKPEKLFTTFELENYDEMIILTGIEFTSFCEHHLLPFSGIGHIGYIPDRNRKRVVGISKLARLLEGLSKRLQIQERITKEVTTIMDEYLQPQGSACLLEANHLCMACRGVKKNAIMITSSLTGVFRDDSCKARDEFLSLLTPYRI